MSENEIEEGKPLEPDNLDNSVFNTTVNQATPEKPPVLLYLGLGGLVVVALLVVFVLPSIVSEYELPLERRVNVAELAPSASGPEELNVSPFEEAQRSIQRKEAQDVLAALLETQAELSELEVETWGEETFNSALEEAAIGDEYYRTQDFELATESYESGHAALMALQDSIPTVISQTLIDAEVAFNSGAAEEAESLYALAVLLDPLNDVAQVGLERSRTLGQVSELLVAAEEAIENSELEQASASLREAMDLDSFNDEAPARLEQVAVLIKERDFAQVMSRGYALLEADDPAAAISVFQEASNMGINQDQALAAIAQTENEIANVEITGLRDIIDIAESQEQWQVAADNYAKVLDIDSNLTFAIEGLDYASKRAQLDRLLVDGIANPERLSEDDVFEQTLDVYYTGRGIENPGPVLSKQLDELEVFLENSQVPIDIQLISDNLTDVTLLRVGHIGLFERHEASLKPGRYVAVGKRSGFREVREEFVVGFDQTPSLVVVKCDERVASGSR